MANGPGSSLQQPTTLDVGPAPPAVAVEVLQATPLRPAAPATPSSYVTPPPTRVSTTAGPGPGSAGSAAVRVSAATPGSQQPPITAQSAKRNARAPGPSPVLQRQMQKYSLRPGSTAPSQDLRAGGAVRSCAAGAAVAGASARSSPVAAAQQPAAVSAAAPASGSRASPVPQAPHTSGSGSGHASTSTPGPVAPLQAAAPAPASRPSPPPPSQHAVHTPVGGHAADMATRSVATPIPSSSPAQTPPPSRLGPSAGSSPALLSRPPQAPPSRAAQSAVPAARGSPPIPGASVNSSVARKPWSSPALLPPPQHQQAPRGIAALRQHAAAAATTSSAAAAAAAAASSSTGLRASPATAAAGVHSGTVAIPESRDLATRLDALLLAEDLVKLLVSKAVEQAEARRVLAGGRGGGSGGGMSLSPRWWGRRGEGAAGLVVLELGDEEEGDGQGTGRAGLLPSCGCSVM